MKLPRGRRLRTKIREIKALARAKLEGERQFWRTQKGTVHWIKKELVEIFKKDPVKITVFIGTTYLCYIKLRDIEDIIGKLGPAPFPKPEVIVKTVWSKLGIIEQKWPKGFNFQLFLLSMLVAYMIMEHGWDIAGGIIGLGKKLVGLK